MNKHDIIYHLFERFGFTCNYFLAAVILGKKKSFTTKRFCWKKYIQSSSRKMIFVQSETRLILLALIFLVLVLIKALLNDSSAAFQLVKKKK